MWAWATWAFFIGLYVCLIATLGLVIEHLARPAKAKLFALRSLLVRFVLILAATVAIYLTMDAEYGPPQAIGAAIGTFLLLGAVRQHDTPRAILGVLAAIMLGWTLWGTQTAYQYARRHPDEIVAAGCELADKCPKSDYHTYNRHPEFGDAFALLGQEVDPDDPRVPVVLRKLGAQRIWVDEERVAVYVGVNKLDFSCIPQPDMEFQIYRSPRPTTVDNPVWAFRGKGSTKFTDRLWTNVY